MNQITATPISLSEYKKETNMENIEIEIPMQLLDAATYCAGTRDIRRYLNSVAIDQGHIISTDGHRAFAGKAHTLNGEEPQIIIPIDSVKYFLKKIPAKNRARDCVLKYNPVTRQGQLVDAYLNAVEPFTAIDEKFPNWRRVIPKYEACEYEGPYIQFQWDYLVDGLKIVKALGARPEHKNILVRPNMEGAAKGARVELFNTNFKDVVYVVMPLRA